MARQELRLKKGGVIKPIAAPVDTFVSPGPDRTQELSNALGRFAEGYKRSVLIRDKVSRQEAEEKAESMFLLHKSEMKSWKDVIRIDPEMAGASPYLKSQLEGRIGGQLARTVTDAMLTSPALMQSEDFDTDAGLFIDDLASDLGEQSEAFKLGFARQLDAGLSQARGLNVTARRNETLVASQLALADEITLALDDEENIEAITAALESSIAVMDTNVANETVRNAIASYALDELDVTILDLMDKIPQGPGSFLGRTTPGRALKRTTTRAILERKSQEDEKYWKTLGRTRTVLAERIFSDISQQVSVGDTEFDLEGYRQILSANGMTHLIDDMEKLATSRVSANEPMSGFGVRGSILKMIWNDYEPMTAPQLAQQRISGAISEGDYAWAQSQLAMRDGASAAGGSQAANMFSTSIANAGKRVRISESVGGFASTALDIQLESAAEESMALQLEIEREALMAMTGPERLVRLSEIQDQVVSYYRREGLGKGFDNEARTKRGQEGEDQVVFRRDYEMIFNYSREEFLPEGVASEAINLIMQYEPMPDTMGIMPNEQMAAKELFRALPPVLQTWAIENEINVAGGDFLLQLFGQRAYHRRKTREN